MRVFLGIAVILMSPFLQAHDRESVRVRLASEIPGRFGQSRDLEIEKDGRRLWGVSARTKDPLRWSFSEKGSELVLTVGDGRGPLGQYVFPSGPVHVHLRQGRWEGKRLPESLWLEKVNGVLQFRADVPFEDYLMGVLHREMPGTWPFEALKAQAVATRSYTLSQMKGRRGQSFDVEGSVLDQEFEWISPEARRTPVMKRWADALRETSDEVLRNRTGEILRAFYHADCGGRTTTPDLVWGPAGDFKSVRDPSCERSSRSRWSWIVSKDWIAQQLSGRTPAMAALRSPVEFTWIQSLFDQRVTLVEWWDGVSQLKILSGQNFRQLLGFNKLKSLRFSTRDLGRQMEFSGQGSGHGVGLCQWGSKDWAEKGLSYRKILAHYYPMARLEKEDLSFASATSAKSDRDQISRF